MKKIILLSFMMITLAGCGGESGEPHVNSYKETNDLIVKSCIDKGGIPILRRNSSKLENCSFPPTENVSTDKY